MTSAPESIFHIGDEEAWTRAQEEGSYTHPSLVHEGFIHASLGHQVAATAERFFAAGGPYVVLEIDPSKLSAQLKMEEGEPGERFPHIYGRIPMEAIVGVRPLVAQREPDDGAV